MISGLDTLGLVKSNPATMDLLTFLLDRHVQVLQVAVPTGVLLQYVAESQTMHLPQIAIIDLCIFTTDKLNGVKAVVLLITYVGGQEVIIVEHLVNLLLRLRHLLALRHHLVLRLHLPVLHLHIHHRLDLHRILHLLHRLHCLHLDRRHHRQAQNRHRLQHHLHQAHIHLLLRSDLYSARHHTPMW